MSFVLPYYYIRSQPHASLPASDRRVFTIVREEGADGGLVVQDALRLLTNLLRGNLANQRFFRYLGRLGG